MTTATGQTLQMNYDVLRRLSSVSSDLYTKQYTYKDYSNRTTGLVSQVQYTGLPTPLAFGYTYDALGNIATYTAPDREVITYTYDNLGQLLSAADDQNYNYTYTYDSAGNILTANGHTYDYRDADWKDLLTAFDGQEIDYDASGNPLSYYNGTRWNFTWKNGRNLVRASSENGTILFEYDSDGLRTKKTVSGGATHYYFYAGGQLLRETYDSNVLDFSYDANGYPYALKYNGTTYYYITNLQGDVMYIVDEDGENVASYEYDPFGNIISAIGPMAEINPLRYRGYYYDAETGFYYVSSRYFDPKIGRFVNADVVLDTETVLGFNLFAYCGNNPIIYVDPTGYGRTYVIYYNNPGSGFYDQAMNSPYYNSKSKNVYMISVTSNQDFIDAWNSMSGTIDYVYLYLHGGKGVLYFKGESLSFSGEQSFSSLNSKKVKKGVYLFSCKGGAGSEGNNVAWMFAKLTNSKVYACTGSVSYSKIFGKYYARKAWDWGIIKTFYYQKRYIFWGANIAKSVAGQW